VKLNLLYIASRYPSSPRSFHSFLRKVYLTATDVKTELSGGVRLLHSYSLVAKVFVMAATDYSIKMKNGDFTTTTQ
jgi:hypothetical protein